MGHSPIAEVAKILVNFANEFMDFLHKKNPTNYWKGKFWKGTVQFQYIHSGKTQEGSFRKNFKTQHSGFFRKNFCITFRFCRNSAKTS